MTFPISPMRVTGFQKTTNLGEITRLKSVKSLPKQSYHDTIRLPIPVLEKSTTSLSQRKLTKNISSESRNLKGVAFFTDGKNVLAAPKIYAKTDPFYLPKDALKKDVSLEQVFKEESKLIEVEKPKGNPSYPMVGKMAKIQVDGQKREATVLGFDYKERPIVHLKGDPSNETRIIKDPEIAKTFIPDKSEYQPCIKTLERGKVFKPTQEFCKLMNYALTRPIVGNKAAMHYIDWLHNHGSEAFVLGGAIRDISREITHRPNLTPDDAVKIVNDIDVSVVGSAQTAVKMFKDVHGNDPDLHVDGFAEYGCVHGKIGEGAGFDYNAMMIGNHTYDPRRVHPDIPEEGALVPAKFGGMPEKCSEALDFCCNSLMYDPINELIIDPTGHGLEDAVHGLLRLTGGEKLLKAPEETLAFKQPEMLQRFWKFRLRGMKSNAYTTMVFQLAAVGRWTTVEKIKMYNDIMRMLPVSKLAGSDEDKKLQLEQMLDNLGNTMDQDDKVSENPIKLNERFLKPNREEIIHYILDYKKKK